MKAKGIIALAICGLLLSFSFEGHGEGKQALPSQELQEASASLEQSESGADSEKESLKKLEELSKSKDAEASYGAMSELAQWQRENNDLNKAERALDKFKFDSARMDRLSPAAGLAYLRCVLESAHLKALKGDVPGSMALLNWAEGRKNEYEKAIADLKYAEILIDLDETPRAKEYAKSAGDAAASKLTQPDGTAIGEGGSGSGKLAAWEEVALKAKDLASEAEALELAAKYGDSYGSYVKLRRLQESMKRSSRPIYFKKGLALCKELEETDPNSQFAAAAGYLKCELLLSNPAKKEPQRISEAKKALEKFIKASPDGLYRGEALMLLGKISLEREWDAKESEKWYSQACDWFKKARERRDALSLYAPMSDELKKQSAPDQKPTSLDDWKRLVYHDEDPLKLYNTSSAPPWYADDKEKNCLFVLGLLAFSDGNYERAKECWDKTLAFMPDVASLDQGIGNIHTRFMSACKFHMLIFYPEEISCIKDRDLRLRLFFADYLFMQEKFDDAIAAYERIFNSVSNVEAKAVCMVAEGMLFSSICEKDKSFEKFKWVLEKKELAKSLIYGRAMTGCANSLMGVPGGYVQAKDLYAAYISRFGKANPYLYREAGYNEIVCVMLLRDIPKARSMYEKFKLEKQDFYVKALEENFNTVKEKGRL